MTAACSSPEPRPPDAWLLPPDPSLVDSEQHVRTRDHGGRRLSCCSCIIWPGGPPDHAAPRMEPRLRGRHYLFPGGGGGAFRGRAVSDFPAGTSRTAEVDANIAWLAAEPRRASTSSSAPTTKRRRSSNARSSARPALSYPNYRVWVLDDGRRALAAATVGATWLPLSDPARQQGRKGRQYQSCAARMSRDCRIRLNSSPSSMPISCRCPIPDAPMACFPIDRSASCRRRNISSTPIRFRPILPPREVWPDEQRLFFDVVMPVKDAWGAAFCCGTSSVIRFAPLCGSAAFRPIRSPKTIWSRYG